LRYQKICNFRKSFGLLPLRGFGVDCLAYFSGGAAAVSSEQQSGGISLEWGKGLCRLVLRRMKNNSVFSFSFGLVR
jgi:hypothetical protein